MAEERVDPPKGLLNLELVEERVRLGRYFPSDDDVGFFIEHYWIVEWDLRGLPAFTSETLPYPSVHVVLERGDSRVVGPPTGKFSRKLRDRGIVFGIKFKPGGFHPFVDGEVSRFTNRSVPLDAVLQYAGLLEASILPLEDDRLMVDAAEALLRRRLPQRDPHIPFLVEIVERVAADRSIVRVDQIVSQVGMGARALQRLFREYVGVTPKWVIQRYRLFEAAARLAAGEADGARVARELGYFDQAHFIRDFKAHVGKSPGAFSRDRETVRHE
jgi:AraC-like DNA-binding protein